MKFMPLADLPSSLKVGRHLGSRYTAEFEAMVRMSSEEICEITEEKIKASLTAQRYYQALRKSAFAERLRVIQRSNRVFVTKR